MKEREKEIKANRRIKLQGKNSRNKKEKKIKVRAYPIEAKAKETSKLKQGSRTKFEILI
jgi:hypothetical protein